MPVNRLKALAAFALAFVVTALPVIPPEHVHEQVGPSGLHHAVAHRHAAPHALAHRHADSPRLDDVDPVLVVGPLFITTARVYFAAPALPERTFESQRSVNRSVFHQRLKATPIHGPPRGPCSLRAPPLSSSL